MTLWRIYRLVRRLYALLVLLAAASGIGPGAVKAPPAVPAPPAVVAPAPAPAPPARKVIGQCATGGTTGAWYATCVVDGAQYTLPGTHAKRDEAREAIRVFRAANA